jgi:class 3 adenylate cyclase
MGKDEEGTHERLKAHLQELVDPKIKEHRGRIVKNTGDGLLAEFASVVDAVRCAVEIQRGIAERNAATPLENRIEFRVGINLGCSAAIWIGRRIASPEMFPDAEMLPHLICSRPILIGGAKNEADQHGSA